MTTETLASVARKKPTESAEHQAAVGLVRLAQQQGLSLTGPDGLLKLSETVLKTALSEEMTEHLGWCATRHWLILQRWEAVAGVFRGRPLEAGGSRAT